MVLPAHAPRFVRRRLLVDAMKCAGTYVKNTEECIDADDVGPKVGLFFSLLILET